MASSAQNFVKLVPHATQQMIQELQPQLYEFSNFVGAVVSDPNFYFQIFVTHVQNFINRQVDYVSNLANRIVQNPELAFEWAHAAFGEAIQAIAAAVAAGADRIKIHLRLDMGSCVKTGWGEYGVIVSAAPLIKMLPSGAQSTREICTLSMDEVEQVLPWWKARGAPCCIPVGSMITIARQDREIKEQATSQGKSGPWPSLGGPRAVVMKCEQDRWLVRLPTWQDAQVWISASTPAGPGWECPGSADGKWCRGY